jgi:hypothetical protein
MPRNNTHPLEGIEVASMDEELLSYQKYFTLELVDKETGMTLFKSNTCALESQSWQTAPKAIIQGNFTFSAIKWLKT